MAAQRFASAAASVALRAESLDDEYAQRVLVTLFGLYQQATVGDCIEAPPRRFGSLYAGGVPGIGAAGGGGVRSRPPRRFGSSALERRKW